MFWVVNVSNSSLLFVGAATSLDSVNSSSKIVLSSRLNIIVILLTRSVMWAISIGRLSLRISNISGVLDADGLGKISGEDSEEIVDNDDSVDDSEENVDNDDSVDDSTENVDNDDSVNDSEENTNNDDSVDDSEENVDNDDSVDVFIDSNECSDLVSRDDKKGPDVSDNCSIWTSEIGISWVVWEVCSSNWFSDNAREEGCVDISELDNKGLEIKYCVFSRLLLYWKNKKINL